MPAATKSVIVPIPVGIEFEEAVQLLLRCACWDQAVVEVLRLHENRHPEAVLYRNKAVQLRVQEDGLDDVTDRDVLHAVFDSEVGLITLNTSVELMDEEFPA